MRVTYPGDEEYWIELPDVWRGSHAQRRDEVIAQQGERYGATLLDFAISMALLDDWNVPGMSGNPDRWDTADFPLTLIAWVNQTVLLSFLACWTFPKNS